MKAASGVPARSGSATSGHRAGGEAEACPTLSGGSRPRLPPDWAAQRGSAHLSCRPRLKPTTAAAAAGGDHHRSDRKSTRLNSSHQIISYAVFCLKKKKNKKVTSADSNQ